MGDVIKFVDQIAKHRGEDAKRRICMRRMNQWYFRNRRLMQEAADKRKALQDNLLDSQRDDYDSL